jgi:hypothetical protein
MHQFWIWFRSTLDSRPGNWESLLAVDLAAYIDIHPSSPQARVDRTAGSYWIRHFSLPAIYRARIVWNLLAPSCSVPHAHTLEAAGSFPIALHLVPLMIF